MALSAARFIFPNTDLDQAKSNYVVGLPETFARHAGLVPLTFIRIAMPKSGPVIEAAEHLKSSLPIDVNG